MDILSVIGATASLECALLLLAGVLFLDYRNDVRRQRLIESLKATIAAGIPVAALPLASLPLIETTKEEEVRPKAA